MARPSHTLGCCLLLMIAGVSSRMPATFKASMCYDVLGKASVRLRCPPGYTIETLTSFTGISRYNACSYMAWDCVIQEGATRRCDGRSECAVSVSYTEALTRTDTDMARKASLSCGAEEGQTKYFQIEYQCRSGDGRQAVVFEPSSKSPETQTTRRPHTTSPSKEKDEKQYRRNQMESKVTLVAIVCGSAIAMIFVVIVMATLAHRIKKRVYENSSVYGLLTGGGGGQVIGGSSCFADRRNPSPGGRPVSSGSPPGGGRRGSTAGGGGNSPIYSSYRDSQCSLGDCATPRTTFSSLGGPQQLSSGLPPLPPNNARRSRIPGLGPEDPSMSCAREEEDRNGGLGRRDQV